MKIKLMSLFVLVLLILSGCNSNQEEVTFEYTNIVDVDSRKQVVSLLSQTGVHDDNINLFFDFVDEFYTVPYEGIADKGFASKPITQFTYETFTIEEDEKHWKQLGFQDKDEDINCRVAAFTLMQEFINLRNDYIKPSSIIDESLLQQHHLLTFTQNTIEKYALLFNDIQLEQDTNKIDIAGDILQNWKSSGISFQNDTPIKLICLYLYDKNRNIIQVVHAATLVEMQDYYYIIEKYNPKEPYQFSKFKDTDEIITYLLQRFNQAKLNSTIIIMKNDKCIYGL